MTRRSRLLIAVTFPLAACSPREPAVVPSDTLGNAMVATELGRILNDETLEGFRHKRYPVFCVQYHPEAAPGPHDSYYLFDDFVDLMKKDKGR